MTFAIIGGASATISITDEGAEAVRYKFNPSALAEVERIKTLTAALVTELHAQQVARPDAGREYAVAITNVQTASMWAVLAATKEIAKNESKG